MAEKSKIGWTEGTWNIATGCTKVSPGCDNCYMDRWAARAGRDPTVVRKTSNRVFRSPLRWQRDLEPGRRMMVFASSLTDWFHKDCDGFRAEAWGIVRRCPDLVFQILTKRHGRIDHHLPDGWGDGWDNVWLGVSVEDGEWLRRATALNKVPARVRFLSMEPLVGAVDQTELRAVLRDGIGWVIVGGESGAREKVRSFHERHALDIVEACAAEGVPCFVKQRGAITVKLEGGIELVAHDDLEHLRPELDVRAYPA